MTTHPSNENLYDISLSSRKHIIYSPQQQQQQPTMPIMNHNIPSESIPKRPGDYFVQKLTSKRMSADSFTSYQSSSGSEENSSIISSQFDSPIPGQNLEPFGITTGTPECRLSSMTTATSIVNEGISEEVTMEKQSMSTRKTSFNSVNSQPVYTLKSSSTSSMIHHTLPMKKSPRSKSTASIPTLHRTKTRYISSKETKERQILRKKKYEENDDEEEILSNDLDNLIFNVPVIKNTGELYKAHTPGHTFTKTDSFTILSRRDLIDSTENNKYNIANTSMKPCPLPGKLTISTNLQNYQSPPTSSSSKMPTVDENSSIISSTDVSFNDEYEITQNISEFYNNRSASMSKLLKLSRQENIMYKLPTFIKSQSSIEDLHLISPEKLAFVDQTRPINLPPKNEQDKIKHNKEFKRVLSDFEVNTKLNNDGRVRNAQTQLQYKQQWFKIIDSLIDLDSKSFNKQFNYEKNNIRRLIWDCNIPLTSRFNFFMKILSSNQNSHDSINTIKNSFTLFEQKYQNLSQQVKTNKNDEFDIIIENCLQKPLIKCLLDDSINLEQFKNNYRYLLYIKSISEFGLHQHDEIFLIPILLILFVNESIIDIYCLLELLNQEIFDRDLISHVNSTLSHWTNIKPKQLSKFTNSEFDNLNSNSIFEMILQFSDKLPLSLSASSTPILTQAPTFGNPEDPIYTEHKSSCFELISKFFSMLIIYSNSIKSKTKNNLKLWITFTICIFKYYHLNWNNYQQLIKDNIPIRINNSLDSNTNLESFVEKWKGIYKK